MTPEEVQKLKAELVNLQGKLDEYIDKYNSFIDIYYRTNFIDKMVLTNPLVLRNTSILIEGANGLKIGTASTDKMGFYGAIPVVRAGAISAPSGGATQDSEARTAINSIITALHNVGLIG